MGAVWKPPTSAVRVRVVGNISTRKARTWALRLSEVASFLLPVLESLWPGSENGNANIMGWL
jgi:hypothetical protein